MTEATSTSNYVFQLTMRNKVTFHMYSERTVYRICWLWEVWSQRCCDKHLCNPSRCSPSWDISGRVFWVICYFKQTQTLERVAPHCEHSQLYFGKHCSAPGLPTVPSLSCQSRNSDTQEESGYILRVRRRGHVKKSKQVKATRQSSSTELCAWDFGKWHLKHLNTCTYG